MSQIDIICMLFIYLIMEDVYNNDFIARKYLLTHATRINDTGLFS